MSIVRPSRQNAGKAAPVLLWGVVLVLATALLWIWMKGGPRNVLPSPPATQGTGQHPAATPALSRARESAPPAGARQDSVRDSTAGMVSSAAPPNVATTRPPLLELVPTSRPAAQTPIVPKTAVERSAGFPTDTTSVFGTAATSPPVVVAMLGTSLPPFQAMIRPSVSPTVLSTTSPATASEAEAKFLFVLTTQLALARRGFSPGSMDGTLGSQTRAALRAFQEREGLPATGEPDTNTLVRLSPPAELFAQHTVSTDEVTALRPVGRTWLAKSEQERLDHETLLELIAEKYATGPKLIQRLNPGLDWSRVAPGATVRVPAFEPVAAPGKAAYVKIFLGRRMLQVFDENNRLLAHFPCSIAQRVEKRPAGETLRVAVVVPNPNYTFDPSVFPESPEAQTLGRKLILPPGPNNPVGTAWIGLDKPGYGIHGTPKPEEVGRTESHGCFRLANWNAEQLLRMVSVGTPVIVEP